MTDFSKTLFSRAALNLETVPTPPVWMMRQAGRYHKHYQALRAQHSFLDLCRNPELACETTMGPIEDFDFDAAILFSDILYPLDVLGMGLEFPDSGPKLSWNLRPENIEKLDQSGAKLVDQLGFQFRAMELIRKRLPSSKGLIGFVGGPWTLFCYAVEGSHKGVMKESKQLLSLFEPFCDRLIPLLAANMSEQARSGADIVMIFDTAAGELSPQVFERIVAPQLARLSSAVKANFAGTKIGYYAKGISEGHFAAIDRIDNLSGRGLDHRFDLPKQLINRKKPGFLQGNFDQGLLFLSPDEFEAALEEYLSPFKKLSPEERRGWVCGLGHGVLPKTPEANVRRFVQKVRETFR